MIYVYAITAGSPAPQAMATPRGFDDAPLLARGADEVSAVYADVAGSPRPTRENALAHERVVEALMADCAVLPARFGTVLRDEATLDGVLAMNHERLIGGLERVGNCVELGVRVLWQAEDTREADTAGEPEPVPAGGESAGRAYLLARAAKERQRQRTEARAGELAANLNQLFRPCARDGVVRVLPTPQFVMAAAYLVPRDRVAEFRSRVEEVGAAFATLRLLCTGPWPPYHFVPELVLPSTAGDGARAVEVPRG